MPAFVCNQEEGVKLQIPVSEDGDVLAVSFNMEDGLTCTSSNATANWDEDDLTENFATNGLRKVFGFFLQEYNANSKGLPIQENINGLEVPLRREVEVTATLSQIQAPSDTEVISSNINTATTAECRTNTASPSPQEPVMADQLARRSEINSDLHITKDTWIISLVRNAYRDKNQYHTFLVLEGYVGNLAKIFFMDFISTTGELGLIRYAEYGEELEPQNPLFNRCNLSMMKIQGEIECKSYNIRSEDGQKLAESVKSDIAENNHPRYIALGQQSLFNSSSEYSGSEEGHNCYSWAVEQIRKLNIKEIQLPGVEDLMCYIVVNPGRYLPKRMNRKLIDWVSENSGILLVGIVYLVIGIFIQLNFR